MFKSLRWRIQFWQALLLGIVVLSFGGMTYWHQHHQRFRGIDDELAAAIEVLVGKLQAAPPSALRSLLDGSPDSRALSVEKNRALEKLRTDLHLPNTFEPRHRPPRLVDLPYFVIWSDDGSVLQTSNATMEIDFPLGDGSWNKEPKRRSRRPPRPQQFRNRGRFREAHIAGPPGTRVLVGRSISPEIHELNRLAWMLGLTGVSVLAIGLLGGWLLSTRIIRPIEQMSQVASEISATNLSQRIDIAETDSELGQLAETLNRAFSRLESAFQQQIQFTNDASHELRTPLTIALTHQELALSRQRSADEYRASIETSHRATQRMKGLVDSLLALARLDADALKLHLQATDLTTLIRESIQLVQPLAASKEITIYAPTHRVTMNVDPEKISQVIVNLLSNAIQFSEPQASISVSLEQTDREVLISVVDSGTGIPESELPQLFHRFYRVEEERSRHQGGSGLGLAICKSIVESHHGHLSVISELGAGSTFTVHLPRSSA